MFEISKWGEKRTDKKKAKIVKGQPDKTFSPVSSSREIITQSGTSLENYFPAGSTAVDTIKTRINNGIQRGTLQINGAVLTLEDLRTVTNVEQKIATKRYKIGLAVAIILWIASILVSIFII